MAAERTRTMTAPDLLARMAVDDTLIEAWQLPDPAARDASLQACLDDLRKPGGEDMAGDAMQNYMRNYIDPRLRKRYADGIPVQVSAAEMREAMISRLEGFLNLSRADQNDVVNRALEAKSTGEW